MNRRTFFGYERNTVFEVITSLAGFISCIIVFIGLFAAMSHYLGDGIYSPVNHFISELGLSKATGMAHIFNHSLMVAGVFMMIFVIGLGRFLGTGWITKLASFTGIITTASFSSVGYFTADTWIPHLTAATIFFSGAMVSIVLFAIAFRQDKQQRMHPLSIILALIIVGWSVIAVLWPKDSLFHMANDPENFVRPAVWILPMLEWIYCLLLCAWICTVSFNMIYLVFNRYRQTAGLEALSANSTNRY